MIIERKCSGTVAINTISTHGRWSIIYPGESSPGEDCC